MDIESSYNLKVFIYNFFEKRMNMEYPIYILYTHLVNVVIVNMYTSVTRNSTTTTSTNEDIDIFNHILYR